MYKLLNKLFEWDYIHYKDSYGVQGIARVHVSGDGEPYFWRSTTTDCLTLIESARNITWLTCAREKYFGDDSNASS